ncbi:MAG: murein L,D-transpeptidase family protein [Bacteroidota bacterium]|jgi:murein L,D-transpeptidase YafK
MKKIAPLIALFLLLGLVLAYSISESAAYPAHKGSSFRSGQLSNARVKAAYKLKWNGIRKQLARLGTDSTSFQLFLRAFKTEGEFEIWVKSARQSEFKLYAQWPICSASGTPGPKRCQGDAQVPEGFYHINVFNPASAYHLSLGVSYPNASDKVFACKKDPGGAIMIHGNCVTIGCIPLTDDKIRELYVLAVEAKDAGQQKIPVHIFPARMSNEKMAALKKEYTDAAVHKFWSNLQPGYNAFENSHKLPAISIDAKGKYVVN